MAHQVANGRLVVFGGGGYNIANVARAWTAAACVLADYPSPAATPQRWRKMFEALVGEKAPESMNSDDETGDKAPRDVVKNQAVKVLDDLKGRISLLS